MKYLYRIHILSINVRYGCRFVPNSAISPFFYEIWLILFFKFLALRLETTFFPINPSTTYQNKSSRTTSFWAMLKYLFFDKPNVVSISK